MSNRLRVLILEDSPCDAELMLHELRRCGFDPEAVVVETEADFSTHLQTQPDIILADYSLPQYNAVQALATLKSSGLDIPLIVVTGVIGDEEAAGCIKAGAADYLLKDRLARLGQAVSQAIEARALRAARRKNELLLRRYELLSQHARDAILFVRVADSHILEANEAAELTYGYSRQELLQMTLQDLRAVASRSEMPAQMEIADTRGILLETWNQRRDGSIFAVEVSSQGADMDGERILVNIVRDITERRRAAEALQHYAQRLEALHQLDLGILATKRIEEIARAALIRISELTPSLVASVVRFDQQANAVSLIAIHPPKGPLLEPGSGFSFSDYPSLAQIRRGQISIVPDMAALSTPSHTDCLLLELGVRSHLMVPLTARGAVLGALNIGFAAPGTPADDHIDIARELATQLAVAIQQEDLRNELLRYTQELEQRVSERTAELAETAARLSEREATLRQANERLTEMDRMKSQFVSNASHELRTPLTNIKLYLEMLDSVGPEKRRRYMATLTRETDLLHSLIEDLLQLSRLDLGKAEPVLTPVDLVKLVSRLVGDRAAMAQQRGLALQAEAAADIPQIRGDPRMLLQVFSNLVTNAMNYTPTGGRITVMVAGPQRSPETIGEPRVAVSVSDTGYGITPEDQAHLFERFYRGEAARRSQAPGTGLGLSICSEIAKRHGGHIEVASKVGEGSTFVVWLPVMGPS